jgi:hypothetical protein
VRSQGRSQKGFVGSIHAREKVFSALSVELELVLELDFDPAEETDFTR